MRRSRRIAAGTWRLWVLALLTIAVGSSAVAAQSGISDGLEYFIEAEGKKSSCLTVEEFLVLESHCFKKDYRQIFRMRREAGGWRLIPQHSFNCLQAGGAEGSQIREAKCSGANAQVFELKSVAGGAFELRSNKGKCLEVEDAGAADQAAVVEAACGTSDAQLFRIPLQPAAGG